MKLLLILVQGFTSVVLCSAVVEYFYPPVIWQQDNCPFRQFRQSKDKNTKKEFFMKVLPYTGMNILCASDHSMNTWGTASPLFFQTLYENLWLVNKEGYDKCEVNDEGKLMLVCNNRNKPKALQLKFHPRYSIVEPRFIPGNHYYFISTSRGILHELTTRKKSEDDGHCMMYHMKLHIYVCNPKVEDCIWEPPVCDPPREIKQRMLMIDGKLPGPTRPKLPATRPKPQTRQPTTQAIETATKEQPSASAQTITNAEDCKNETSVYLVMNFILGGVIVFLIVVVILLACALSRSTKERKPKKVQLPPEQNKKTRIYESIPVQRPPVNMVPIGSPQADYLVYAARPCTPDPLQHTLIRTPHHNYETPVFRFPTPQRSRAGSTQARSSIQLQGDNMDSVSV